MLIITLSILATCLVSSNCSVTHVRWGEGTSSVLFKWRPAFSALWRCGNSVVSVHHINNFWNTRSNLTKFSGQSPQWLRMVCAKLHVKRLRIDWDINEKRSADVVTTLAQCFALTRWTRHHYATALFLKRDYFMTSWLSHAIRPGDLRASYLNGLPILRRSPGLVTNGLITFEVLNQTPPNLLGSCRSSSRWYLQNYIKKRLRIDVWIDV